MRSSGGNSLALRSAFIALPEADAGACNARLFQKRQHRCGSATSPRLTVFSVRSSDRNPADARAFGTVSPAFSPIPPRQLSRLW